MDSQRLTTLMQRYNAGERGALEAELAAFVGPLLASGWFELFAPAEWMRGDNPARRLLGTLAQAELNGPQK